MDRKLFARNADLNVREIPDRCGFLLPLTQSGPAHTVDLNAFTSVLQMRNWEFAAYASYEADGGKETFVTLAELFGVDFAAAWKQHLDDSPTNRLRERDRRLPDTQRLDWLIERILLSQWSFFILDAIGMPEDSGTGVGNQSVGQIFRKAIDTASVGYHGRIK